MEKSNLQDQFLAKVR